MSVSQKREKSNSNPKKQHLNDDSITKAEQTVKELEAFSKMENRDKEVELILTGIRQTIRNETQNTIIKLDSIQKTIEMERTVHYSKNRCLWVFSAVWVLIPLFLVLYAGLDFAFGGIYTGNPIDEISAYQILSALGAAFAIFVFLNVAFFGVFCFGCCWKKCKTSGYKPLY